MKNDARGYALVTGATAGIGRDLAQIFAENGHPLILVARNETRLAELKKELSARGVPVESIAQDLSRPEAPEALFGAVRQKSLNVEFLVNNAGVGLHGPFLATDFEKERQMIHLNISSLTALTKLFLRDMAQRGRGRILNVASTAAFQPGPYMAVYYATKAYVLSFSEALANELKGSGVTVSVLCPGPTHSEFQKTAGIGGESLVFRPPFVMESHDVAREAYKGLMRGKRLIIPGIFNKFSAFGVRLVPRGVVLSIVRRMHGGG